MKITKRTQEITSSITLKLNDMANKLMNEGKTIYNLTAGQLPFRPHKDFVDQIGSELNFLKSFQYAPVAGIPQLCEKFMSFLENQRNIAWDRKEFSCLISNGAKHSLFNILGTLIDPGDEVILLAPYWISYPTMIELWGGKVVETKGKNFHGHIPSIQNIKSLITDKTKAIILNNPNNPTGICLSKEWMEEYAQLMKDYPHVITISDEIYFGVYYFDPKPFYFYQNHPELLKRTIVVEGISKTCASTGLRIGVAIGPQEVISAASRLQGHTTSGASALIQNALLNFDFEKLNEFLDPIRSHLRANSKVIRNLFRDKGMAHSWYQTTAAFYYMVDFSQAPVFQKYKAKDKSKKDFSAEICQDLLEKYGVAMVPGSDFGHENSARLSLVLENNVFAKAIDLLTDFLAQK